MARNPNCARLASVPRAGAFVGHRSAGSPHARSSHARRPKPCEHARYRDNGGRRTPSAPDTRARTNAGVGPAVTSNVLITTSEARRVVVRRVPPLIGLTSLLFSAGGYAQAVGAGPIRQPALRSYEGRRRRHRTAGAALGFAISASRHVVDLLVLTADDIEDLQIRGCRAIASALLRRLSGEEGPAPWYARHGGPHRRPGPRAPELCSPVKARLRRWRQIVPPAAPRGSHPLSGLRRAFEFCESEECLPCIHEIAVILADVRGPSRSTTWRDVLVARSGGPKVSTIRPLEELEQGARRASGAGSAYPRRRRGPEASVRIRIGGMRAAS